MAAGTSSTSPAGPARAAGGTRSPWRRRRSECPGHSARDPPSHRPKPGSGDTDTTRIVAAEQTRQAGGSGLEAGGKERAGRARGAGGAGGTHAGPQVPSRGRQQLQGRTGAGEPIRARQAAQHRLGVRQVPDHDAEARARLRGERKPVSEAAPRLAPSPIPRDGSPSSPRAADDPSLGGMSSCAASSSASPPPAGQGPA